MHGFNDTKMKIKRKLSVWNVLGSKTELRM